MEFSFDALRRHPDVEAPNLFAVDASDRLILDTAGQSIQDAAPGELAVIGDRYGALTLGAAALHGAGGIRVHQDALSGERAIAENAARLGFERSLQLCALDAELLHGARVILLQLPRSLDALDEIAQLIARHAARDVTVYAGGRVKHMSHAMNEVLARSFGSVTAGLARQKSRVLTVREPLPEAPLRWPRSAEHDDLIIWAHGAAFAGTRVDIGTRFLLDFLDRISPAARSLVDLGCGTGVLAVQLARLRPDTQVTASDQSAAAAASARLTVAANGVVDRVNVVRDDGLSAMPDASVDAVVLNPPFHIGASVHAGIALKLFAEAGRVLRPGGELLCVWNSHLQYRGQLERLVGPTEQLGRNAKFTVTLSRRR